MNCCKMPMDDYSIQPITGGRKVPHFYCTNCHKHFFRGMWYSAEAWFFYINGDYYGAANN